MKYLRNYTSEQEIDNVDLWNNVYTVYIVNSDPSTLQYVIFMSPVEPLRPEE